MTTKEEKIYREELRRRGIKPNSDLEECADVPAFLKAIGVYVVLLILTVATIILITEHHNKSKIVEEVKIEAVDNIATVEPVWTWDNLIDALIEVESEGDPLVSGKTNDLGILQITPIYVADVNRILDTPMYTLEMRTDIEKSLEMFEIYQHHYNPERDISKAIKLHNPRAGKWYEQIVMNQLNKLKHEAV